MSRDIHSIAKAKERKATLNWCPRDYKNNHCWNPIGITSFRDGSIKEIFRCTQCDMCKMKDVSFVYGD